MGDLAGWVSLDLEHESGVVSSAALSGTVNVDPHRAGVELYGEAGVLEIDCTAAVGPEAFATVGREFAAAIRGAAHDLDVHRGLHLQHLLHQAETQLLSRR